MFKENLVKILKGFKLKKVKFSKICKLIQTGFRFYLIFSQMRLLLFEKL